MKGGENTNPKHSGATPGENVGKRTAKMSSEHTGTLSHVGHHMKTKHKSHKGAHETHHSNNKKHGMPGGFQTGEHYAAGPQNPEGNESHD